MLNAMRSNRKFLSIVLWLVILAFLSTIFVVWGLGPKENQGSFAVKIGDDTISYDEYKSYYDNAIQTYRNSLGDNYEEFAKTNNIDKMIIDDLINRRILINEAKRLGVVATNMEIIATIRTIPAFQKDGRFDIETYQEVLRFNRQTPAKFEEGVRADILLQKVNGIIRSSAVAVTDIEILNEYNARNVKKMVNYVAIPLSTFTPNDVTATQVEEYFNQNKDKYKTDAEIKLKYIAFNKADFKADNIQIPDSEVERFYSENIAKYTTPETVNASHIITTVTDWNDNAKVTKAKEKIDMALAEIKKPNSDFGAIAKKYSEDQTATNGGNLGNFTKGQMVKEFEETAFKMKEGEISDIVKSQFGFHIIKLIKKMPETVIPLTDKKEEIVKQLRNNNMLSEYRNYVLGIYRAMLKAGNITAYMATNTNTNFDVKETAFFKENNQLLPIFIKIPTLEKSLFNLAKTDISQLIEDGDKTYLFEINDKIPSVIPDLKSIYSTVEADYIKSTQSRVAMEKLNKMLQDNMTLKAVADEFKTTVSTVTEMSKSAPNILSTDINLYNKIFRTKDGDVIKTVYIINNFVIIAQVIKSTFPDTKAMASENDNIKTYIMSVKSDEALKSYVDKLKSAHKIIINETLMPVK